MIEISSDVSQQVVQQVMNDRKHLPGALLPILHEIQAALGYIPAQAIGEIASELNLSRAEVHGVVSYYHDFRLEPAGRHSVKICRAEACQSMGSERLWSHAQNHLGCASEGAGKSVDGEFALEPAYCLGLCASSPAMALDGKLHARVDPGKFDDLVKAAKAGDSA